MDRATAPPRVPGEDARRARSTRGRDEAEALLEARTPAHARRGPFEHADQRWVGVRDGTGRLVACRRAASATWPAPRSWPGITVRHPQRGAGWVLAVTAHLTRLAVGRGRCLHPGHVRRQRRRPPALPRARVTTGMEWTSRWFERLDQCLRVGGGPPPVRRKARRCPRSATVSRARSTSRTAAVTAAPCVLDPRLAAQRRRPGRRQVPALTGCRLRRR